MRELDSSPNAKEALDIAREQERTKQIEYNVHLAQLRGRNAQQQEQMIKKAEDERRKTLEQESYLRKQEMHMKREMEKKRMEEELAQKRYMKGEKMERERAHQRKLEEERRKTIDYQAAKQRETDQARIAAEVQGQIKREKENHDLYLERSRVEAAELRKTVLDSIKEGGKVVGEGVRSYLSDGEKVFRTIAGVSLLMLGIYSARTATGVVGRYIESQLGKPSLVRDTSQVSRRRRRRKINSTKRTALY